jgi:predicted TPR repeat methyltransferase
MSDAKFWNKIAPKYAKDPISNEDAYHATLDIIRGYIKPTSRVIELGCGTGSTALLLAENAASYHGTDIAEAMIEIARDKITPDHAALSFDVAPADTLPADGADIVLALNLLHVVSDLDAVLSAAHAALPQGGHFIAKTALMKEGNWIIPKIIPLMQFIGKAPSVLSLSEAELNTALENNGFEIVETLRQKDTVPRLFTVARKL